MKKKIILLVVLALVLCGVFLVFGGKKATVKVLNKETMQYEQLTLKELNEVNHNSSRKYENRYHNSPAIINAKVKGIEGPYYYQDGYPSYIAYNIRLENGWYVRVHEDHEIMNELEVGYRVEVKGVLSADNYDFLIIGEDIHVKDIKITDKK